MTAIYPTPRPHVAVQARNRVRRRGASQYLVGVRQTPLDARALLERHPGVTTADFRRRAALFSIVLRWRFVREAIYVVSVVEATL